MVTTCGLLVSNVIIDFMYCQAIQVSNAKVRFGQDDPTS